MSEGKKVKKFNAKLKVINNSDGSFKEERIEFNMSSDDTVFHFLNYLKDNEFSRNTNKFYYFEIKNMLKLKQYVSKEMIFNYLRKKNGLVKRSAIKKFLKFIRRETGITLGEIEYPRFVTSKKVVEAISKEDVYKIITKMPIEYKLFTELLFIGGLRISEGVKVYAGDFSFKKWIENKNEYGHLLIVKAKGNKQRLVPLNPMMMKKIYDYIISKDGRLIDSSLLFDYDLERYMKIFKKRCRRDNVPYDERDFSSRYIDKVIKHYQKTIRKVSKEAIGRNVWSHLLRASRATQLDELNVSITQIRDLLGHDSIATTDRYLKASPRRLTDTLRSVEMNTFK